MSEWIPIGVSYSGGTSSEWMIEAVIRGAIPRPRSFAVFIADTRAEHEWTYPAIEEVEARCRAAGIPFFRGARRDGLENHILRSIATGKKRMDQPPFYIAKGNGAGRAAQRCTKEFKTSVTRRMQRAWLDSLRLPKSCRVGNWRLTSWIGFAADETKRAHRALATRGVQWERLDFPAIRMGVTRAQQRRQLIEWTGRAPLFSACVFCPYKTPDRWAVTSEKDRERAIGVDEAVRNLDEFGLTEGPAYVSNKLIPLRQLLKEIKPMTQEEWAANATADPESCDSGRCFV